MALKVMKKAPREMTGCTQVSPVQRFGAQLGWVGFELASGLWIWREIGGEQGGCYTQNDALATLVTRDRMRDCNATIRAGVRR